MRISDWSSDVCSSDLSQPFFGRRTRRAAGGDRPRNRADSAERGRADGSSRPQGGGRTNPAGEDTGEDRHRPRYVRRGARRLGAERARSEEHTSALPSLLRIPYAVFCLQKKTNHKPHPHETKIHKLKP